jgi:hypothetical protein
MKAAAETAAKIIAAETAAAVRVEVPLHLGLGEAVLRLLWLEDEVKQPGRKDREALRKERLLLIDAMNRIPLDLGFDCDDNGVADTAADLSIFRRSAHTSCCRLLPPLAPSSTAAPASTTPEAKPLTSTTATAARRSTSRRRG